MNPSHSIAPGRSVAGVALALALSLCGPARVLVGRLAGGQREVDDA